MKIRIAEKEWGKYMLCCLNNEKYCLNNTNKQAISIFQSLNFSSHNEDGFQTSISITSLRYLYYYYFLRSFISITSNGEQ